MPDIRKRFAVFTCALLASSFTAFFPSHLTFHTSQHTSAAAIFLIAGDDAWIHPRKIPGILPLRGYIVQYFGEKFDPGTGQKTVFNGVDIAARNGSPVLAPADGLIQKIEKVGAATLLTIDHGSGYITRLLHLNKIAVKAGAPVKRGDCVGFLDNTGSREGPFLHLEIWFQKKPVDPLRLIYDQMRQEKEREDKKRRAKETEF